MNRPLAVLAAAGLSAGLALATAPAHAAPAVKSAAASTQPAIPANAVTGTGAKLLYTRAPTAADIAAGVSPNAPIYGCGGRALNLINPDNGTADAKLFADLTWEQSATTSGRAEARFQTGSSAFVESNRTGYSFFFEDGLWWDFIFTGNRGGNWVAWHISPPSNPWQPYFVVVPGGGVGITVHGTAGGGLGDVAGPWETVNATTHAPNFRQFIENYGGHSPIYLVGLYSTNRTSHKETDIYIPAQTNNICLNLETWQDFG